MEALPRCGIRPRCPHFETDDAYHRRIGEKMSAFWILDLGFWIGVRYVSYPQAKIPNQKSTIRSGFGVYDGA